MTNYKFLLMLVGIVLLGSVLFNVLLYTGNIQTMATADEPGANTTLTAPPAATSTPEASAGALTVFYDVEFDDVTLAYPEAMVYAVITDGERVLERVRVPASEELPYASWVSGSYKQVKMDGDNQYAYYLSEDLTELLRIGLDGEIQSMYEVESPYTLLGSFAVSSDGEWAVTAHEQIPFGTIDDEENPSILVVDGVEQEVENQDLLMAYDGTNFVFMENAWGIGRGGGAARFYFTDASLEVLEERTGSLVVYSDGEVIVHHEICDFGDCPTKLLMTDITTLDETELLDYEITGEVRILSASGSGITVATRSMEGFVDEDSGFITTDIVGYAFTHLSLGTEVATAR